MGQIQRVSLPDQVAALLRAGIDAARWTQALPSEAELCREFQVSRVTLRKAIAQLVHERWIALGGHGRNHRIRRKPGTRAASRGRIIRVLSPYSRASLGATNHVLLDQVTERIAAAGYRLEFEHHPGLYQHHQPARLQHLDALPETAAWLLFFTTEPMQRWFASSGRPCLVLGRLHPGVELPCIYPDTAAIARHAAGLFFSRGHRELVYLRADFTSLGDRLASEAFAAEARRLGASARIVVHAPDVPGVRAKLAELFAARPRPSGFLIGAPEHSLTALCHLLGAGIRIPADAALVCTWDDPFLQHAAPTIARYRIDAAKMGRKTATLLLDLIRHGAGKTRSLQVLPEFVSGETI